VKRKRSRVRVIQTKVKINYPKPDCPNCGRGVLEWREYIHVATEEWEEWSESVQFCPVCGWIC
jgi:ribosomal protein S27AE